MLHRIEKRPMGGAWGNGFQGVKFAKRNGISQKMIDSMSDGDNDGDDMMDIMEKRSPWGSGFQGAKFGKRSGMSQDLENSMSYEDEDDDMMDFMKKRSDLDFLRQRMGKRSDLNFLKQRMGKRLIQRFGKREYLLSPIDERDEAWLQLLNQRHGRLMNDGKFDSNGQAQQKRDSGFYRLIKRAPYRSIKQASESMKESFDPNHHTEKRPFDARVWAQKGKRPFDSALWAKYRKMHEN